MRQKIILAGVETKYRLSWTSPDGPTKMFRSFFTLEMYGTLDPPDQKSKPPWPFKLISSTRFVQRWEDVLEENGQITFYKLDGSNGTFPKLEREGEFSYFKGDGFQAVRLSYVGGDVYLAVYLPNDRTGLPDLLKKVYSPEWIKTSAKFMSERPGKVVLPSFRMGVNGSLREPLESMGVQTAFKQWAAYPGLFSNPSLLQSLDQKCKLEVTQKGTVIEEEGIEGGVEGGIMPENGPPPPPPFLMVVDHPFVFEIWDQTTGSLLFVGVVTDPEPLHVPVGGIKH